MSEKRKTTRQGEYHGILTISMVSLAVFSSGCAHSPFLKPWDFSIRPEENRPNDAAEKQRIEAVRDLESRYGKNWKTLLIPEESRDLRIDHYDEKGRRIGTSVAQ